MVAVSLKKKKKKKKERKKKKKERKKNKKQNKVERKHTNDRAECKNKWNEGHEVSKRKRTRMDKT